MQGWILPAIFSAIFAACVPVLAKHGLPGIDSTTATAVRAFVMAAFFGVLLAFRGAALTAASSMNLRELSWIAASGLVGALSWLCYFGALKRGPVTAVVALDRTSVIFAVLLARLFLAERLTVSNFSGALLIAVGAFLVAKQ